MSDLRTEVIRDFQGLNLNRATCAPNEFLEMLNVQTPNGVIEPREGYRRVVFSQLTQILGIWCARFGGVFNANTGCPLDPETVFVFGRVSHLGKQRLAVVVYDPTRADTSVYGERHFLDNAATDDFALPVYRDDRVSIVQLGAIMLVTTGDGIFRLIPSPWRDVAGTATTDTTFEVLTAQDGIDTALNYLVEIPRGKHIAFYMSQLWITGDPSTPNRLYHSETVDIITAAAAYRQFPDTNFIDLPDDEYDRITGIIPFYEWLVVFKERSIWIISGPGGIGGVRKVEDKGCVAMSTVKAVEGGLVFLSADGLYVFDGNNAKPISKNLDPIFKPELSPYSGISGFSAYDAARATAGYWHERKQYWLSLPGLDYAGVGALIIMDLGRGAFYGYDVAATNDNDVAFGNLIRFDGTEQFFLGIGNSLIYWGAQNVDISSAFSALFSTGYLGGSTHSVKNYQFVRPVANGARNSLANGSFALVPEFGNFPGPAVGGDVGAQEYVPFDPDATWGTMVAGATNAVFHSLFFERWVNKLNYNTFGTGARVRFQSGGINETGGSVRIESIAVEHRERPAR